MKIIFIPLKFFQLTSTIIVIAAVFAPCEISRKNSDRGYLFRTRHYNFYDPSSLYDVMVDDIQDSSGAIGLFKVLYVAVAFSIPTAIILITMFICQYACKVACWKLRLAVHLILLAFWIPFTFAFLWTVAFSWSDDVILSNYSRPNSWVVASGASLMLIIFLCMEFYFMVIFLGRNSNSDRDASVSGNYWKKGQPRLAVSLNSIDLDPNCEKLKSEEL